MSAVYGEQQQNEIATIKERTFMLKLSDADVRRIHEKAGGAGLTVSELLQNFIGDLVCGTYSNGSDERDDAEQWFDRCGFNWCAENTFLRYLIRCGDLDEILAQWNDLQSVKKELDYAAAHPEEYDPDDLASLQEDVAYCEETIDESFASFKKGDKENRSGTLEQEMEKILVWQLALYKSLDCPAYVSGGQAK